MEGPRPWVLRKGPGSRVLVEGSRVPGPGSWVLGPRFQFSGPGSRVPGPGSRFSGMASVKSSWFKFFDTEVSMLMFMSFVFILESGYLILFLKH